MKISVYFDLPLRLSRILLIAYLFCGLTLLILWVSVDLPLTLSCLVGGLFAYSVFVVCVRLKRFLDNSLPNSFGRQNSIGSTRQARRSVKRKAQ